MEVGRNGASGQSVEVDVDRVNKRGRDLVPTQDRYTAGETAMDMIGRLASAILDENVLVCQILSCSVSCKYV